MKIIKDHITFVELSQMAKNHFGTMVKAVVDIKQGIMAVDAALHADLEQLLVENGSSAIDLWGINLYPELYQSSDWIEFDSMINLKPYLNNRTRSVEDPATKQKITEIVNSKVQAGNATN